MKGVSFFSLFPPSELSNLYQAIAILLQETETFPSKHSIHHMKRRIVCGERDILCSISIWTISSNLGFGGEETTTSGGNNPSFLQVMLFPLSQ